MPSYNGRRTARSDAGITLRKGLAVCLEEHGDLLRAMADEAGARALFERSIELPADAFEIARARKSV